MDYYDSISQGYNELHKEEQLKKLEIIKKYINPKEHEFLLDVGSGTSFSLKHFDCAKVGIDPSLELLKQSRHFVIQAIAEILPFQDDCFDYIISLTAIQNFNDVKKGLIEIKRVGKNTFILSALKKSNKIKEITGLINELFLVKQIIEEQKDLVFVCGSED